MKQSFIGHALFALAFALISCGDDSSTGAPEGTVGSLTDSRDGLTYKTIVIGRQTWMAENLNYDAKNSLCPKGTSANCTKYGRLYTWSVAKTCPRLGGIKTVTARMIIRFLCCLPEARVAVGITSTRAGMRTYGVRRRPIAIVHITWT